jgi:peptidoglycan/xylan/chitin deacetylase (PgdA/CDA1 family)
MNHTLSGRVEQMPVWKRLLLASWYGSTYAYRAARLARLKRTGRVPVVVLTYHRVADDAANCWTVSRRDFERQLDWLRGKFQLVSLEEAQYRIASRANREPCVAITFDDGYAVNCEFALPLLIAAKVPVTYFVCTGAILQRKAFPHDLKMGNRFEPNTLEQLRHLAEAGIDIGAHTRTHCDLGRVIDPQAVRDEVVTAGEELQQAVGRPVRYFAFPYGGHRNLSARAFELAHNAGYDGVCSAYGGYNWPGDDPFHLQRICVDGPLIRTKNWATIDPWKERKVRRFFYGPELVAARLESVSAL